MPDKRDAGFAPAADRGSFVRKRSLVDCIHGPSAYAAECEQCKRDHDKLFEELHRKRGNEESKPPT